MVKYTHGKCRLRQLAVSHDAVGLESLILGGTHSRKIDRVFGAPVVFLQIAQMICHHGHICTPIFLQAYEHTHTDGVHTGLPHTVKSVAAPFKTAFHATRMVYVIVLTVVGLLEANHTVHAVMGKFKIILGRQRHHLNLYV